MPEHTPAPTRARSIYGFVLYLASSTLFVVYVCWATIPNEILNVLNISYYPQKYWAIAVPLQLLFALWLFAFVIYPCLNLLMTPNIDNINTIVDNFSLKQEKVTKHESNNYCDCMNKKQCSVNNSYNNDHENELKKIPHVEDLDMGEVCQILYSK